FFSSRRRHTLFARDWSSDVCSSDLTTCAYPGSPDSIEFIGTRGTARIEGASMVAQFHDGTEIRQDDGVLGGGAGADPMAFPHDQDRKSVVQGTWGGLRGRGRGAGCN